MAKPIDVRHLIASLIAVMSANGDEVMVNNLRDADAAIADIFEVVRLGEKMPKNSGLYFTEREGWLLRHAVIRAGGAL
ncbi:hypothetical protein ISN75_06690 [Dyella marensis]|uniref:hypothetical protein n=1 Tax=Dyella marensis TaxID=500610 RepID=UPI0031DE27A4